MCVQAGLCGRKAAGIGSRDLVWLWWFWSLPAMPWQQQLLVGRPGRAQSGSTAVPLNCVNLLLPLVDPPGPFLPSWSSLDLLCGLSLCPLVLRYCSQPHFGHAGGGSWRPERWSQSFCQHRSHLGIFIHPSVLESAGISPCSNFLLAKPQLDHRERHTEDLCVSPVCSLTGGRVPAVGREASCRLP